MNSFWNKIPKHPVWTCPSDTLGWHQLCLGYPHCIPSSVQQAQNLGGSNFSNGSNQQEHPKFDWVTSEYNDCDTLAHCVVLIHDISNPRM